MLLPPLPEALTERALLLAGPCRACAGPFHQALRSATDGAEQQALSSVLDSRDAAGRLLLGLNFYGTDFDLATGAVSHLTGAAFRDLMAAHGLELAWDARDAEHVGRYRGDDGAAHAVYYPSLRSIQVRLVAMSL